MSNSEEHPRYDSLINLVKNYHRGVIGPSVMWDAIFTELPPESARRFLESLPDHLKLMIRSDYFGRSWFRFQPPEPTAGLEVAKIIAQWCEEHGDPAPSPDS